MAKKKTNTTSGDAERRPSLTELAMLEYELMARIEEVATLEAGGHRFVQCNGCGTQGTVLASDLDANGRMVHAECELGTHDADGEGVGYFVEQPSEADRILDNLMWSLEGTQEQRDDKLDRITALRSYWLAQQCHMHAEIERLKRAAQRKEAALDRLELTVRRWLEARRGDKSKLQVETYTGYTRLSYYESGKAAVEFLPGKATVDLPPELTRQPPMPALEPDKEAIGALLAADVDALTPERLSLREKIQDTVKLAARKMALRWL